METIPNRLGSAVISVTAAHHQPPLFYQSMWSKNETKWPKIHIPMQAPTLTSDFNCLPTDIITVIASNSGQVWRSLVLVDHKCSDTLNDWKAYVKQFTAVGVVTKLSPKPSGEAILYVQDPSLTRITLFDGVPHSEDGVETWSIEVGAEYSIRMALRGKGTIRIPSGGTYRHGKPVSAYPAGGWLYPIAWKVLSEV